ncbi:MAG: manganese efflux pump [Bacilli bacterium]|nr:manganese efflux pump [Bacilli bacterium]
MTSFLPVLLIGISLSMDAFSLALVYGMIGISKKKKIVLSFIVGVYHYIMPLIGLMIGSIIDHITFINLHIIAAFILIYIGIDLIISNHKEEKTHSLSMIGMLLFGLSVSIDSLTIGIGLREITTLQRISAITFSLCSILFTYLGLILGHIIGNKIGTYSKILGGTILIIIAIIMFIE